MSARGEEGAGCCRAGSGRQPRLLPLLLLLLLNPVGQTRGGTAGCGGECPDGSDGLQALLLGPQLIPSLLDTQQAPLLLLLLPLLFLALRLLMSEADPRLSHSRGLKSKGALQRRS